MAGNTRRSWLREVMPSLMKTLPSWYWTVREDRNRPRSPAAGRHPILAARVPGYFATGGASNGPTEAVNLIIEKTRRLGHDFRSYRLLLLLRCGGIRWKDLTTPRVRTCRPRSAAQSPFTPQHSASGSRGATRLVAA